jgi:hypothetical protein
VSCACHDRVLGQASRGSASIRCRCRKVRDACHERACPGAVRSVRKLPRDRPRRRRKGVHGMPDLQRNGKSMQDWKVSYSPLKEFVSRKGGTRLYMHGKLVDSLVDIAVREFPADAPSDRMAEVLAARMKIKAREKYGSIIAMLVVGILINVISKLIVEWWNNRKSHRVLMQGWKASAEKTPDVPPTAQGPSAT